MLVASLMLAMGLISSLAQVFPVICTEAVPADGRAKPESLKDVPVSEIVKYGGLAFINDQGNELTVNTWRQFVTAHQNKYWEKTQADIDMADWISLKRGFIPFLEAAIPATNGFVRNLKPGEELVRLLPLTLAPLLGEESNILDKAARKHERWLHYFPNTEITRRTNTEMSLKMGRYIMTITTLAFGDFDHDGLDDMLIAYSQGATDGTFSYSGVAVLTRRNNREPLMPIPTQLGSIIMHQKLPTLTKRSQI